MHIPKTAGASLARAMQDSFPAGEVLRLEWFDHLVRHSKIYGLKGVRLVICHIAGRELSYLEADRDLRLFTFLRDPVERVVSNFDFWRQTQMGEMIETQLGPEVPVADPALDWEEDLARVLSLAGDVWKFRELTDAATWQLATSLYERESLTGKEALRLAQDRLNAMAFVGFHDRIETDYHALMTGPLGLSAPAPLPRLNRTGGDGNTGARSRPEIDATLRAMIEARNEADLELYARALSRA